MIQARRNWICSTLDVSGGARAAGSPTELLPMGVAAKDKLWPKETELKIRFLQGSPELQQRTLKAARAWFLDGVKLRLVQVEKNEKADFSVAFNPDGGSWSYIGTDSRSARPMQPTMNLDWATMETPDDDFSSVVLHEFGHALGLLHEHNHPGVKIEWDKSIVNSDLGGKPNYWDQKTIDDNVFARFDASKVITTNFDNESVMIYTVPLRWTTNGVSFMPSWKLSKGDEATIRKLYG